MGTQRSIAPRIALRIAAAAGIATALTIVAACRDADSSTTEPEPVTGIASFDRQRDGDEFTRDFALDRCTFTPTGKNPFFNLTPGYTLVLAGDEDGDEVVLRITVLNQTRQIARFPTRVVEERETKGGVLVEVSRNYFAICKEHNGVFYFGEDVDIYENGQVVSHDGAWLHGVNGARAGLIMPGLPLLGAAYFQEIAPGVALDRAEIERLDATVRTPAGRFTGVLLTEETTPLEPQAKDFKWYAPDVGLVRSNELLLVERGFSVSRR